MGRGKLKMELIENEKARMITYQKRKKCLMKKVEEFSILCRVDACLIIFRPIFNNCPVDIQTWPSDPTEIRRIIKRYTSQTGERKKNQDLSHFLEFQKKKLSDEIAKLQKAKFSSWDNRLDNMGVDELGSIASTLESKIRVAKDKILKMKGVINHNNNFLNYMFGNSGIIDNPPNNYHKSMATTFANALQHKITSNWNQFDHQMIPINVNPMISPRLMMLLMGNNENFSQFVGESSSSNKVNNEQVGGSNYGLGKDQILGNMVSQSMSYNDVISGHQSLISMHHPMLRLPNVSHQNVHISRFSEFCGSVDDVELRHDKGKFQK